MTTSRVRARPRKIDRRGQLWSMYGTELFVLIDSVVYGGRETTYHTALWLTRRQKPPSQHHVSEDELMLNDCWERLG